MDLSFLLLQAVLFLISPLHPRFYLRLVQELPPTGDSGIEGNLISIRWFISLRAGQIHGPFVGLASVSILSATRGFRSYRHFLVCL
jgi:hypothetical protein